MNSEQAIKDLMFLKHTDLNVYSKYDVYSLEPSIDIAISALRAQAEREDPKPLTLEQLKERVGKPVWIQFTSILGMKSGKWMILRGYGWYTKEKIIFTDADFSSNDYGKNWLAYDHEPKEAQR